MSKINAKKGKNKKSEDKLFLGTILTNYRIVTLVLSAMQMSDQK